MIKNSFYYTFIAVVSCGLFSLFMYSMVHDSAEKHTNTIAILMPATHEALAEIERGFKETLQQLDGDHYTFVTFNTNGNKTLLRAQAEEIIAGQYDLIFTIGAGCSQTIAELSARKQTDVPQVFAAIDYYAFADELRAINSHATGATVQIEYHTTIDILHTLLPRMKSLMLVYDPTHGTGLESERQLIAEYAQKYGIAVHGVQIYHPSDIQQRVTALLSDMDAVLVLVDNTIVSGLDALCVLCKRYQVPLCASDLLSGKKGAAIAYGIKEYDSGRYGAQKAYELLVRKQSPSDTPITVVKERTIELNKKAIAEQGLSYEQLMQLMPREMPCR